MSRPSQWSEEDTLALIHYYTVDNLSQKEIADKLNRPLSSIKSKISTLGIVHKTNKHWTDEDIEKLRHLYTDTNYSLNRIAEMLGRTPESIRAEAQALGLKRKHKYTPLIYKTKDNLYGKVRPYTQTSDMLIAQFLDEDNMSINMIAYQLDRDPDDLKKHIEEITNNGILDYIRSCMLDYEGIYYSRVQQQNKEDRRNSYAGNGN